MNSTVTPLLSATSGNKPRVAIFLSGSGSNAERVMERARASDPPFEVAALVTDSPETSRARELGGLFGLPVVEHDIRRFYSERGETRVSIATACGQKLRQEWTDGLRRKLADCRIDFAVFAGFVPLTNLTGDFPCLNVHPGDLTYLKDGQRHLIGLHTVPIERAILEGLDHLRSSVIQALPYTGKGDDMDNGPILGISGPVPIDLQGARPADLQAQFEARPARRPKGGYGDALEQIAKANQESLKIHGDWTVLPAVVSDFAAGRFGLDGAGKLCCRIGKDWHPIVTVAYSEDGCREILFRDTQA